MASHIVKIITDNVAITNSLQSRGDRSNSVVAATTQITSSNAGPTAIDDSFSTNEQFTISGNVLDDNLFGADSDPDGDTLTVTAINGDSNAIGTEIMLASGAPLTLNADGSFDYDPTEAFDDLSAGDSAYDSFVYTISDGNGGIASATVNIYLRGHNDSFWGTPDQDILEGTDGDDGFYTYAGDDFIFPGLGLDYIDGGEGYDTVIYDNERAEFVTLMPNGEIFVTIPVINGDRLVNIERIEFTDGDLVYDLASPNVGLVYRMYHAGFGRTPDEAGLRFWVGHMDVLDDSPGSTQRTLAEFFAEKVLASDEFKDLYGSNPNNAEYIDAMYLNVLGRIPDDTGRAFWIDGMEKGLGRDDILIAFSECDENVTLTAPDIDNGIWVL